MMSSNSSKSPLYIIDSTSISNYENTKPSPTQVNNNIDDFIQSFILPPSPHPQSSSSSSNNGDIISASTSTSSSISTSTSISTSEEEYEPRNDDTIVENDITPDEQDTNCNELTSFTVDFKELHKECKDVDDHQEPCNTVNSITSCDEFKDIQPSQPYRIPAWLNKNYSSKPKYLCDPKKIMFRIRNTVKGLCECRFKHNLRKCKFAHSYDDLVNVMFDDDVMAFYQEKFHYIGNIEPISDKQDLISRMHNVTCKNRLCISAGEHKFRRVSLNVYYQDRSAAYIMIFPYVKMNCFTCGEGISHPVYKINGDINSR